MLVWLGGWRGKGEAQQAAGEQRGSEGRGARGQEDQKASRCWFGGWRGKGRGYTGSW